MHLFQELSRLFLGALVMLPLLGCGGANKFILWKEAGVGQGPATECYDWTSKNEGNFLSGTKEVRDREQAASQYEALLSIEKKSPEPFDRNCLWTEYLWSKANFAACTGDARITDESLDRLIALPVDSPQTCAWDFGDNQGFVSRRVVNARILAEAHIAAARRSDGMRGQPDKFRVAFERQALEARKTLGTLDAVGTSIEIATAVLAGVDKGLHATTAAPSSEVPLGLTRSTSLASGTSSVVACADNGSSCQDDVSVRQWRSRCETQTSAQGPCYCAQAAILTCFINHGCYSELAGARAASTPRAKLQAGLTEAMGLANSVGTACTGLPAPDQPVFSNEPPRRRPLAPSTQSGSSTTQDCNVPAGATACPAF